MKNRLFNKVTANSFNSRLTFLITFFSILFLVLFFNIARLQITKFDQYTAQSKNNQISVSPIAPVRGRIYDRNGVLLAGNRLNYDLYIIPELVTDINQTLEIASEFSEIGEEQKQQLHRSFKTKRHYKSILIKSSLNEDEINKISSLKAIYPEFNIQSNWVRYYPYGVQTAHIVGYVGRINQKEKQRINLSDYRGIDTIGKTGIESVYENQLRGKTGFIQSEKNAYGINVRVLQMDKAISGKDIFLSLDIRLQGYAASLLDNRPGSIVMLDNDTSGVLAMVSAPSFDSNWFIGGISQDKYDQLLNNPDKPLLNRSINGQYPPGSIIKPFVLLAGLENHTMNENEEIYCPGWYQLPNVENRTFYGWKRTGHGQVDAKKAIVESCDIYFYELAARLGINKTNEYLNQYALGEPTGIDIEYESSGLIPSTDWKQKRFGESWFLGETLIAGIGQGYMLLTPLQAAFSTLILANQGTAAKPKLLYAYRNQENKQTLFVENQKEHYVSIKNENFDVIMQAMKDVVHSRKGTANHIGLGAIHLIAGKTGTAQVMKIKRNDRGDAIEEGIKDHAWFTAFTPIEDPKISIAVIVENSGGGSSVAAPVARKMIDRYYNLYPL